MIADQIAKDVIASIANPNECEVTFRADYKSGILLPEETGKQEVWAKLKVLTFGDNFAFEKASQYYNEETRGLMVDSYEISRLMIKRNLLDWNLNIPIVREGGWMTDECWKSLQSVSAPLLSKVMEKFLSKMTLSDKEEEIISTQSVALFSKNSRGVAGPCEAIRLFCTLGGQWEKFGHKREDLDAMAWKDYLMIKSVMENEREAISRNKKSEAPSNVQVARGSRIVPGRGKRIAL